MYPGFDELHSFVVLPANCALAELRSDSSSLSPTLSKKIRKLEERVGVELISRFVATMRGVVRSEKVSAISR
jgi:hypothetical protein